MLLRIWRAWFGLDDLRSMVVLARRARPKVDKLSEKFCPRAASCGCTTRTRRAGPVQSFERPCPHLAFANIAIDQHTAGRGLRRFESERGCLRTIVEQALAAAEQDRVDQQAQLVDEIRGQQLVHQVAAALGDEAGSIAALELAYRGGDVRSQRVAVAPFEGVGMVGGNVLGGAVEQVGD